MRHRKHTRIAIALAAIGALSTSCSEGVAPKACLASPECEDGEVCSEGICIADHCQDGIISKGESDIDCGHVCKKLCDAGQKCALGEDCETGTCQGGLCIDLESDCGQALPGDLIIAEVLNNISAGKTFDRTDAQQTEFFEIVNLSNKKLSLKNIEISCLRTDDGKGSSSAFKLSGCLEAKHILLVSGTEISGLPEDAASLPALQGANKLTNTADYTCSLTDTKTKSVLHTVKTSKDTKAGISETLSDGPAYRATEETLVAHNSMSKLRHSPGFCTNGALYKNNCDTLCANGLKDTGETDTDCGGALCEACTAGKTCLTDDDCDTKKCTGGTCEKVSCTVMGCALGEMCDETSGDCHACNDGMQNGDETDTDCGGTVCAPCATGNACSFNDDCASYTCSNGTCTGPAILCIAPQKGDLVISEVYNRIKTGSPMAMYSPESTQTQAEFIEIVNLTDGAVSLDGLSLKLERTDNHNSDDIALKGCLPAHQATVISGAQIADLPSGVRNLVALPKAKDAIVNTAPYSIRLLNGNEVLHAVHESTVASNYISRVLQTLEWSADDTGLVNHDSLNGKLKQSPGYCTNGALFIDGCTLSCENGERDDNETDTDCGGACDPCAEGLHCDKASDCLSENCVSNTCGPKLCTGDSDCQNGKCDTATGACSSCSDRLKNGDETDIDCGGTICGACESGKNCLENTDCLSMNCTNKTCTGTDLECLTPKPGDLILTEILNNASISTAMQTYTASSQKQVEFIEIANLSDTPIDLNAVSIRLERQNASEAAKVFPLKGCLPAYQAAVISGSALEGLPDGVVNILGIASANALTNTATYLYTLTFADTPLHQVQDSATPASQKSRTIPEFSYASAVTELVDHPAVNAELKHSPGYCTNGMRFVNHCESSCLNDIKDDDETDVDCGGACQACASGKNCAQNTDCLSGQCQHNTCTGTEADEAAPDDVMINEVMGTPYTSAEFDIAGIADKQCEFVEIVNISGKKINLSGLSLYRQKVKDNADDPKPVALSGILDTGEALVVSECDTMNLPYDAHHLKASLGLTNGEAYTLDIRRGQSKGQSVTRAANSSKSGVSQNRSEDLSTASGTLVLHSTLGALKNSPGYCSNGNTFKNGCK